MALRSLIPLALATATAASSALSERAASGFLSFPIERREVPTQRLVSRDAESKLYNISTISYLIELNIGSPGQSIKVAIDTGSDELWVNPDCTDRDLISSEQTECKADGIYVPSSSSSSTKLDSTNSIQYGIGEVNLQYYEDDIALAGTDANLKTVQFGVATETQDLNEGVLGLGFSSNLSPTYATFVDQLASQKVTNSKAFSVALGSDDANNGGVIIFGGVDTKKFAGNLVSNQRLGPQGRDTLERYWIQMTGLSRKSGDSTAKTYENANTAIVLDTGSSLSYLPSALMAEIAADLDLQFDQSEGAYVVDCSVATSGSDTLSWVFGKATISIPLRDLVWQISSTECYFGATDIDANAGIAGLLGDTFLRSAYVVFDQTTNTISMAQYANCGDNEQAIPSSGAAGMSGECDGGSSSSSSSSSDDDNNKSGATGRSTASFAALVSALVVGLVMTML